MPVAVVNTDRHLSMKQ